MPAPCPLYHTIAARLATTTAPVRLPAPSRRRLALLVTSLLAARSTVLARIAIELFALHLTLASSPESVNRRLRRPSAIRCCSLRPATNLPCARRSPGHPLRNVPRCCSSSTRAVKRISSTSFGSASPVGVRPSPSSGRSGSRTSPSRSVRTGRWSMPPSTASPRCSPPVAPSASPIGPTRSRRCSTA